MKLSNIFLVILLIGLSVLPFLIPERADYLYNYYRDMANGKIICHCDKMEATMESVRQNYEQNHKIVYILDCESSDEHERDHTQPVRIFSDCTTIFNRIAISSYLYPSYDFSIIATSIPTDTPPPKYSI